MRDARMGAVLALCAAVVLTGCTGGEPESEAADPSGTTSGPVVADPEAIVETRTVIAGGGEVEVGVHPLVRVDEHVVLTVDLAATALPEGGEWVSATDWFDLESGPGVSVPGGAFRLVDGGQRQIHLPALDAEERPVGTDTAGSFVIQEDGLRLQRVFADSGTSDTPFGLLIPGGYIDELPVIDAEPPAPVRTGGDESEPVDVSRVADAPVLALESATRQLDGAVQVVESIERVEISLSGDVLFATGSADLGADAATALDAAAATLESRSGGVVDVVGHTDDVGDDAANQDLSQRRAASVAAALASRIDESEFDIQPSGRGESEPFVANSSDENRQLNRRVALTLTTEQVSRSEVPGSGEIPPFDDGPVVTGSEGIMTEHDRAGTFRITAPAAHRVDGMLVVTVEVARTDDGAYDSGWAINLSPSTWGYRGEGAEQGLFPFAPQLLVGSTAVFPLDYMLGESSSGAPVWRIAGDNDAQQGAGGGQIMRFTALYPDVEGASSIAIQNAGSEPTFRFTDIPVE